MVYTAHVPGRNSESTSITIRDDRGTPTTELTLPARLDAPDQADEPLRDAGWAVTAGWTATDSGWAAPVEPA